MDKEEKTQEEEESTTMDELKKVQDYLDKFNEKDVKLRHFVNLDSLDK